MTPYKNVNQCINECQVLKDRAESFLENARSINEEFRIERDEGKGSKNYSLDDVPYGEEVCVIEEFVDEIDEYINKLESDGSIDEFESCEDLLLFISDTNDDNIGIIEKYEKSICNNRDL